jgi:membrane protease YdiL (CAAX protease family)
MQYPVMHVQEMLVLDHVLAFIICVIAPLVAFSSQKVSLGDMRFDTTEKIKLYHSNAMFLIIIALAVISVWRITGKSMGDLGFDWPVWNNNLLVLFGLVLLFYCVDLFFQYGLKRWRDKTKAERNNTLVFVPSNAKELLHFSTLALAAGIGEEIIFRGFLIQYIVFWVGNDILGLTFAAVFSSAIFAFLHGYQGFKSIVKIFFLSLIISAIFILSRSLVFVIIIHAIIDLVSGSIHAFLLGHDAKEKIEEE